MASSESSGTNSFPGVQKSAAASTAPAAAQSPVTTSGTNSSRAAPLSTEHMNRRNNQTPKNKAAEFFP
ncbi:unnamed protein product [Spirodela intermedia]|uniref:Uncharacterized protein n=1 Tax=Spirodela intermedia TaxID=51605 RepID=A0A7I8JFS2_SPIIN|nr:unnamed protein product [Spirodela intermedia]CAA6668987.1 unnamed protein product [Spirodela intermedia]